MVQSMSFDVVDRLTFLNKLQSICNDAFSRHVTLGLLVIDLLEFRRVNAVYGFQIGNEIIKQTVQRLRAAGFKDSELFRVGGDEFALILKQVKDPKLLTLAANKVLRTLSYPYVFDGEMVRLEAVIGIAISSKENAIEKVEQGELDIKHAAALLSDAEANQATAKAQNKRFLQYRSNDARIQHDWQFESMLHQAVSSNSLSLYYQPKVHMQTQLPSQAEALSRWRHPDLGIISPVQFIPVLEKTGGIADMTKWVIHTALREVCSWPNYGADSLYSVSINVSASVLEDAEFPEVVKSALNIWGVNPQSLILEITEGALIQEQNSSYKSIHRLKDLGLKISIDDFGTGYSCLSYFKSLPADELKIDQSFITNLCQDKDDEHLARVIIDLAHKFNMSVVAEGVEDEETYMRLQEFGCDYAQGFYISKPLPQDEYCAWLDSYAGIGPLKKSH